MTRHCLRPRRASPLLCASVVLGFFVAAQGKSAETDLPGPGAANRRNSSPIVLGYYPCWESGLPPSQIRYELFTHLAHAFLGVTTAGEVCIHGNLPSSELVERAHRQGVGVLASLGGADSGASLGQVAGDVARRRRLVAQLSEFVDRHGYDGIDLDWEFPSSLAERDGLTTLARELRAALGPHRLLASAQSGSPWASRYVDMPALRETLDWVAVMTYDVHGPWSSHAGHNAPIRCPRSDAPECTSLSVEAQMRHWTEDGGWPPERLLLGIPCYGRGFPVGRLHVPLPKHKPNALAYVAFREIAQLEARGWRRHEDPEAGVPWLTSPAGDKVLSFDDESSVRRKAAWARSRGFGGLFFWEITQDRARTSRRHPIIEAARAAYLGGAIRH